MATYKHSRKKARRVLNATTIVEFVTPDGELIEKKVSYEIRRYRVVVQPFDKKKDPKVVSPGVLTAAVFPVIGFCVGYIGFAIGVAFA